MTSEQSYEFIVFLIKAIGIFILIIGALVIAAHHCAPDYPSDDGESM